MKRLFLFAVSTLSVFGQTGAKPPEGSIEGQIVNASTGAPLKKVMVRLVGGPQNQQQQMNAPAPPVMPNLPAGVNIPNLSNLAMLGGRGTQSRTVTRETDDQGRFQFTGLEAGRYSVSANRTGFLSASFGARRNGGGTPIFLSDNQHFKDATIKLTPQAVITGRVLDEDGDPMPNANVKVMRLMYRSGKKQWTQVNGAQTSDIGEYRLPELEPGQYLVGAGSRPPAAVTDKPEMMYASTYYPRSLDEHSAAPIVVGAGGEIRGIDIHMVRVPAVRVRGSIANVPQAAPGRGMAGVQVGLVPRDGGAAASVRGAMRMNDGTFEIRGVQAGSYLIYARMTQPGQGGQAGEMFIQQPLDVGTSHINGLVLTLAPALEVTGQVTLAERDAQVELKNVTVRMRPLNNSISGSAPMGKMEPGGKFTLKGVTPLRYAVSVSGVPEGCFIQSIKYGGQEVTNATGAEFTSRAPLEVVISATAGKITGTVSDKNGRGVMRAIVALITPEGTDISTNSTDDNGGFSFERLKPGRYKLIAFEDVEPGATQDPEFRKPYESRATEITVGPRDQQTAQLKVIAVDEMVPVK